MSLNKEQEALQNALTVTFLANLAFLSEYDNDLFHRVEELSRMIEKGVYKEKYALEFVLENGDFDILDLVNNRYLYNKNPKKINNDLVRKIQFDEKNSFFTLENIFSTKEIKEKLDQNVKFNVESISQSNRLTKEAIYSYTNILKDFLEDKKKRLKEIKKFVFMGTLLGRHIPKIAEKVNAEIYLVCERNLEIFRLSLFTVDYTILTKNSGVIFSIMDNIVEEEKKILNFLNINYFDNYLIKLSTTGVNINNYIDILLSAYVSMKPTSYDYNRYLYTFINRVTKVLTSSSRVLQMNKIKNKFNLLNDTPVLFIAAGPSLDENIDWIKINQNKFFIVTIGAAYKKLLLNDIRIDVISTLDGEFDVLNSLQFDDESVSKIGKETIILASVVTDDRILKKLNQDNLFLYEIFLPFYKENIALSGFSIGELSVELLLNMNVKELYLIGLDLSLNQKTGSTHAENSNSEIMNFNLEENNQKIEFGLRTGTIKIKGNFTDEVFTTALFYTSIKHLENSLLSKNVDVNIYNLSSHGAFFENTIPKEINTINIDSFKEINIKKNKLLELLEKFSLKDLNDCSIKEINKEINFLINFLESDLMDFKSNHLKNYKDFYQAIISLVSLITNNDLRNSSISQIMILYMKIILPYLSYHFNDVKIKNEEKKIIKIENNFIIQLETIIKDYLHFLERMVK